MSFVDLEALSKKELILQFILEHKKSGLFLSYLDYEIIDLWLIESYYNTDLVILALVDFFNLAIPQATPFSLKNLKTKVLKKIRQLRSTTQL